jgi:glycine/D-amino acid oxidase-like deaminating enzyme
MLAPGGELDTASPLATAAMESLREYPEFVRELEEEAGESIDFRRAGAVEVAFSDAENDALERKSLRQAELGIHSESCVHAGFPARLYPDDAVVDPRDVTRALLTACRRRGVIIREHEQVLEISRDGRSVRTIKGDHGSEGVLIAAGAWSSALLPGLPRTIPVRGHLISWVMTPWLLGPILRHGHTYVLQRRSGILVAGASTERVGFDRTLDESAIDDIQSRAIWLLPELGLQPPSERWNGFRPDIEAECPAVGKVPGTSVWTAFGHYRNGILLAPETARRIANMLT